MRQILIFVVFVTLAACATAPATYSLNEPAVITLRSSAAFPGGLRVTFNELVADSRCPINVTCIQMGEAEVRLNVALNGQTEAITLSTKSETESVATVFGHRIELVVVAPQPGESQRTPREYTVTVRVTR